MTVSHSPGSPAPAHAAATPLAGIRVVSIATNVPGPIAVARLVSMGAEAHKVEPPSGDFLAFASRAWYDALRAGQTVTTLDLKSESGREALYARLAESDVFLSSHRPRALARLGLAPESLRARWPPLCIVRILGHAEPDGDLAGHDLTYQAEAGLVEAPHLPVSLFVDVATGEAAATAACALLVARAGTGRGGLADVAMSEVAARLAAPAAHGLTSSAGVLGGGLAQYGVYETRGGWIAVAALEPAFLLRLAEGLELAEVTAAVLAARFKDRTAAEWAAWGRAHDVPMAVVARPKP